MKIYTTSDTHFNHKKLIEYGRPTDFEEKIKQNLFKLQGDLLIHCGDFCIGEDENSMRIWREVTSGFKKTILVRGNHDNKSDSWYIERGFDFVCDKIETRYFGKRIIFSHIPLPREYGIDLNIHGHMHGNTHRLEGPIAAFYDPEYHFDLAPEIRNYAPVNLAKLLA